MKEHQLATHGCWIHGEERTCGEKFPVIDPSTGEPFAEAVVADSSLVEDALKSAHEAFELWRATPAPDRSALLHVLAGLVRERADDLASLVCQEAGKPLGAARDEVLSAASLIDYFAEEALRLTGQVPLMGYRREQVLIVREPVGVAVAITPFNYPLSTLAAKIGPALAAGCTVVAKPDEHTPLSTLALARLAHEAGLPPGAFNVVTGPGEVGRLLVEHPLPRLVTFTGSTEVGKQIQATSARWVRRVVLELGGHCPAIVCRDAAWREALSSLVFQCLKNCGQYCYRISRIYVAEEIHDEFLEAFTERVAALRVGATTDPGVEVGPLNNAQILTRVRRQVEAAVREGARVETGGPEAPRGGGGFYFAPTILTGVTPEMEIMREEVFGPVVLIIPFKDPEEAVRLANASPYGLAGYLFTADIGSAMEWAGRLEVGSVWINRIHQAYPEAPFGGMKESGLGREKSRFGLEEFTELKTIYLSY